MKKSSIVIHKGGKEEKYELYIEDYVMSFLKEETGTLELSECYFYGMRENEGRRYILYGALRDKNLPYFASYTLLEEVGCRLTQAGPVFYVREKEGTYELKGYAIFYEDNQEMQNYLIDRRRKVENGGSGLPDHAMRQAAGQKKSERDVTKGAGRHSAISAQLCVVLIVLVAIVINSANSYDKMNDLNQSATEVFFAMENQEADKGAYTVDETESQSDEAKILGGVEPADEERTERTAEEERGDVDVEEEAGSGSSEEPEGNLRDAEETDAAKRSEADAGEEMRREEDAAEEKTLQDDAADETNGGQDELEALSRNVARYYEVEKGDTLYTISRKIYGDTTYVQEICELNQITDPDKIRYGQKIVLP